MIGAAIAAAAAAAAGASAANHTSNKNGGTKYIPPTETIGDKLARLVFGAFFLIPFVAIVALIGVLIWAACNPPVYQERPIEFTVVEKIYTPSHSGSATGWAFGKRGGLTLSSVNISESYVLIVTKNGKIESKEVSPELWAKSKAGEKVFIMVKERVK